MEHNHEGMHTMRHGGSGFLLPLGFILVGMGLARRMMRHKMMGMHGPEGQRWGDGVPPMFAELHRRAHAAEAKQAAAQASEEKVS